MVETLTALAPVMGTYLVFAVLFCAVIALWVWLEDRNDGGNDNE